MKASRFFDHLGRPLTLGREIGQGGEATVYQIANCSDVVAKIWDLPGKPPSADDEAKLRALISLTRKELSDIVAWPTATLYKSRGGPYAGFVMRKVEGAKEIHTLYSPADRKRTFPDKDWRFLVHVAMNCAAAFDTIHSNGVLMGDVNERNVFVCNDAKVALIDCNSFQVNLNGQNYPCNYGVPDFTPPELQDARSFRGIIRTSNHDNFGLAVLVFCLLFMNRHPFAGRYLGQGEMPIERAIKEYRFAFGRSAQSYQMQTPRHAPPLSILSSELVDLFERAFGPASAKPHARPTAAQWVTALRCFLKSLRPCTTDSGHVYAPHLPNCPWHALMRQGAPNFFLTVEFSRGASSQGRTAFVLAAVWARIEQISRPNTAYTRPAMPSASSPLPWPANIPRTIRSRPVIPAIVASPPSWRGPIGLQPIPSKPIVPSILASPPAWPGPGGLPPLPPKPIPLGILASPRVWRGPVGLSPVPPKPVIPTILTSPPTLPANLVLNPKRQRQHLPASTVQVFFGIACPICFMAAVPVGLVAALILMGLAAMGPRGVWTLVLTVLLGSVFFGFGWLFCEWRRRRQEHQHNLQYEAKLQKAKEDAPKKRMEWENRLAALQAGARQKYEDDVRRWDALVEALRREGRRQYDEWQAQKATEEAAARRCYDEEVRQWQIIADAYDAEKQRQRTQWEAQLAVQQREPRQRFDEEMRQWQIVADAHNAEVRRQRVQWEAETTAQQTEASRRYDEQLREWQNQVNDLNAEVARRRRAPAEARQKLVAAEQNWATTAASFAAKFDAKKDELIKLRDRHNQLTAEHLTEHQRLQSHTRDLQLEQFLEQIFICDPKHKIHKIGRGLKATLASYGIETAFDLEEHRILQVPQFNQKRAQTLMNWRRSMESQFVFDVAAGIPAPERQALHAKYTQLRQQVEAALLSGENELKCIASAAGRQLGLLYEQIRSCLAQVVQADRNIEVIPSGL